MTKPTCFTTSKVSNHSTVHFLPIRIYPLRRLAAISVAVSVLSATGILTFKVLPSSALHRTASSYLEVSGLSESALANLDIGLLNLVCSEALPGAESLDVKQSLAVLNEWTGIVRQSEQKYLPQFHRNPERYDASLAKFKMVNLALTLKQDIGCDYNKMLVQSGAMADLRSTRFFRDSSDLFLHGLTAKRKGSCASLPVLMVAIGRRCGYPVFLVASKGHLFCRWDDGRERLNIETAIEGVDSQPDEYYRTRPHPCTDEELNTEKYLKNLTPAEELGIFAHLRAACLQENNRPKEAAEAYRLALRFFPHSTFLKSYLSQLNATDSK